MMVYKIIVHIIGIILFKFLFHTNLTFCSIHNLPALSLFCQYEPSAYLDQYIPLIPFTTYSIIGLEILLKTSTGFDGGCSTRFAVLARMNSNLYEPRKGGGCKSMSVRKLSEGIWVQQKG